ncbi:MAG: hypothetical protein LBQ78_01280, partial [Tannerellaceae bacterium]|nr:hypothetical protein [Tannerellaceae bacterium]
GTANTVTKTVDIKRAAAGRFGIPTYAPNGGNLLAADAQVMVTASTNMAWHAGYKIGNDNLVENKTQTASTYSSKNLVVNVPDNPVFETRTVYVWANIAGETSTTYSQSYTQAQATLVFGTPTGSQNIPAAGVTNSSDITIPFTGTYTGQIAVEAYDKDYPNDGTIGHNIGSNNALIGVTVNSNNDWSPRTVIFKYAADGLSGSPVSIDLDYIQPAAYTVTIDGDNEYIPGNTYMFDIGSSSNCPDGTTLYFLNSVGTEVAQISTENGKTSGYQVNIPSDKTGDLTINVQDKRYNYVIKKTITPSYHTFTSPGGPDSEILGLFKRVIPSIEEYNTLYGTNWYSNKITSDIPTGWTLASIDDFDESRLNTYATNGLNGVGDMEYNPFEFSERWETSLVVWIDQTWYQIDPNSRPHLYMWNTIRLQWISNNFYNIWVSGPSTADLWKYEYGAPMTIYLLLKKSK